MRDALADTRVVLVNGARQVGKSTLTRLTAGSRPDVLIRLLDDPTTLRAAHDDPTDFVDRQERQVAAWRSFIQARPGQPPPGTWSSRIGV